MQQVYRSACALALAVIPLASAASSDPFTDVLEPGGAAVGYVLRWERSSYRGADNAADEVPLYLYEGEYAYLHGTRVGLKFKQDDWRLDAFIRYRFEGFNQDHRPESTVGLALREPGYDGGVSLRRRTTWGTPYIELLHDVSNGSRGSEARLGYWNEWRRGRLTLKPHLMAAWRDRKLNDFYYGAPGYSAGAGLDLQAALYASYTLTESWNVIGGRARTRATRGSRGRPRAGRRRRKGAVRGFPFRFSPEPERRAPRTKPALGKIPSGDSS